MSAPDFSKARDYAYRLLDVRPRSIRELDEKLRKKGFSEETSAEVIEYLRKTGHLNDEEFARIWLNYRTASKPTGPCLLRYELENKGIDSETIEKVIQREYDAKFNQAGLAGEAVEARLNRMKGLQPDVKRRRLLAYLKRRGFSYDVAKEAVEEMVQ